jgi:dephospho-CoA kinase
MSKSKPLWVGVTGGIGSGKSTVCKVFSILGIPIYAADDRAKWLMANDPLLKSKIVSFFGEQSFLPDGKINRSYLAEKVFTDPQNVKKINSLVHPEVGRDFTKWAESHTTPYVIKEAALLFETGSADQLDFVIQVSSPIKIRLTRVLMRDPHRTETQINSIIDQQMPDEQKNELADFVIKNTENKLIIPQILEIHRKICSKNS